MHGAAVLAPVGGRIRPWCCPALPAPPIEDSATRDPGATGDFVITEAGAEEPAHFCHLGFGPRDAFHGHEHTFADGRSEGVSGGGSVRSQRYDPHRGQ
jgi:hypothetical protein